MKFVLSPARHIRAGSSIRVEARLLSGKDRGYYLIEFSATGREARADDAAEPPDFWSPLVIPTPEAAMVAERIGYMIAPPETGLLYPEEPALTRRFIAPVSGFYRVVQEGGPSITSATITAKLRIETHGKLAEVWRRIMEGFAWVRRRGHATRERYG